MAIARSLTELLEAAKESVRSHPAHDLALGFRRAIWRHIGPRYTGEVDSSARLAHQIRTSLAVEVIRTALPIWESSLPDDPMPHQTLDLIKSVLGGQVLAEQAWKEHRSIWTQCDDLAFRHESLQVVIAVGYGAAQALATALHDELFDDAENSLEASDSDLDPDELDATFFAAAAVAQGTVWDKASSPLKRGEFWNWYLIEAVPAACD